MSIELWSFWDAVIAIYLVRHGMMQIYSNSVCLAYLAINGATLSNVLYKTELSVFLGVMLCTGNDRKGTNTLPLLSRDQFL